MPDAADTASRPAYKGFADILDRTSGCSHIAERHQLAVVARTGPARPVDSLSEAVGVRPSDEASCLADRIVPTGVAEDRGHFGQLLDALVLLLVSVGFLLPSSWLCDALAYIATAPLDAEARLPFHSFRISVQRVSVQSAKVSRRSVCF